jgi:hypothetical protein
MKLESATNKIYLKEFKQEGYGILNYSCLNPDGVERDILVLKSKEYDCLGVFITS